MSSEAGPSSVASTAFLPRAFGVMNIVFGLILLTCLPCLVGYVALIANVGKIVETSNARVEVAFQKGRTAQLKSIEARQKKAETPEEKQSLIRERQRVLATSAPVPPAPDMGPYFGAFKDWRVIACYAGDVATSMVFNLAMIISGVGLVRLREWGRKSALWIAGIKVVRLVLVCAAYYFIAGPISSASFEKAYLENIRYLENASGKPEVEGTSIHGSPEAAAARSAQSMRAMNTVSVGALLILGAIYPILSLWLLQTPDAIAACRRPKDSARMEPERP
jgi:hypothetical protein